MPRLLAIEWDARELRIAAARTRGKEAVLELAFAVPLPARDPHAAGAANDPNAASAASAEATVGAVLREALAQRGLARLDTVVAVGRTNIELRVLSLPPAPPEETPDMVRFQAAKQFTTATDAWPLDFVALEQTAESQSVLAAAIAPELIEQIRKTCGAANVEPKRLVLRPFAAASLWRRIDQDDRTTLMVDLLNDEADLTVLVDGHVGFVRTVRLPAGQESDEFVRTLLSEVRRTIAAASNQLRGKRVERIVVCGEKQEFKSIGEPLGQQLSLAVEYFDPLAVMPLADELKSARPTRAARFAPLIGMLMDEALGAPHAIDFLNPRKRPVPVSHRRRDLLAISAAAAVVVAVGMWGWSAFQERDAEIAGLRKQVAELDKALKQIQPTLEEVKAIDEFTAADVTWLDEMHLLSSRFLSAEEAIASELSFSAQAQGGQMTVEGHVRQAEMIDQLERGLRDERHRVSAPGKSYDERSDTYPWRFKESVAVAPLDPEDRFVEPATPKNEPAKAESSTPPKAGAASKTSAVSKDRPAAGVSGKKGAAR